MGPGNFNKPCHRGEYHDVAGRCPSPILALPPGGDVLVQFPNSVLALGFFAFHADDSAGVHFRPLINQPGSVREHVRNNNGQGKQAAR